MSVRSIFVAKVLVRKQEWLKCLTKEFQIYSQLTRLTRPIGSWLLFWPGSFGIGMAYHSLGGCSDLVEPLLLFGLGSVLMRGAGCIVNDLWDMNIDRQVARTKTRPLASRKCSIEKALAYLIFNSSLSLGILLNFNEFTQVLGFASIPLVLCYPLMKRITNWPQLFLGITFNWPFLLGWSLIWNSLDFNVVIPSLIGCALWTIHYDTIYAHQDKVDDSRLKLKSTALYFNRNTKTILYFSNVISFAMLIWAGQANGHGIVFVIGQFAALIHRLYQLKTVDLNEPKSCNRAFCSNRDTGALMFGSIIGDHLLMN